MTQEAPWFFDERAQAFSSLVLTGLPGVKVQPCAGRDTAIDLLVEVLKHGKPASPTPRRFGVQIVPYMDLPKVRDADERVLSRVGGNSVDSSLPVCVFVVGVRKPEGICRWVVEPVIEEGRPLLRRDVEGSWQPLDEAGVARLIGQVNAWYDARNEAPTPNSRGRPSQRKA
jgi:hypothetical protein